MNRLRSALLLLIPILLLLGCASTQFTSTWLEPDTGSPSIAGAKVAAFVVHRESSIRRPAEQLLARQLVDYGARGAAGYTLVPGEEVKDKDKARKILLDEDVAFALVLRPIDKEKETNYVPGQTYYARPYYRSWGGYWGHGWGTVHTPGYTTTSTVHTVETILYRLEDEQLIWVGRSETTNPQNLQEFIADYAGVLESELTKANLLE